MQRGFLTVATGDEQYYRIAANLLRSYRFHTEDPLPFAILADRENAYTAQFDEVILLENPTNSYLDKLSLYDHLPFEETVFIDADCLAYGDLNVIFAHFREADDFSCHGRVLPLEDTTGWFNYADLGPLQEKVSYCVGLHGGIYYMRKTEKTKTVFETAKQIAKNYDSYHFKGRFSNPGDEPILALSMALNNCRPIPFVPNGICCYWDVANRMKLDIVKGRAEVRPTGQRTYLVHWGTRFTRGMLYRKQVAALELAGEAGKRKLSDFQYDMKILAEKASAFGRRVKYKLIRMAKGQR